MGCATPTIKLLFQWNLSRNPTYKKDYHSTVWLPGTGVAVEGFGRGENPSHSLDLHSPVHYTPTPSPSENPDASPVNVGLFKTQFRNHRPMWLNLNFPVKNSKLSINYHLHSQKPNQIKINFLMWAFHTLAPIFPAICIFSFTHVSNTSWCSRRRVTQTSFALQKTKTWYMRELCQSNYVIVTVIIKITGSISHGSELVKVFYKH